MITQPEFDVFLSHNSQDKLEVKDIAFELKRRGLKVWIDEEQILPGRPFQDVIQQAISNVKSAAIFIGSQGLGKWQVMELRIFISQFVDAEIPVIPVLLPGIEDIPEYLCFLQQFNWVRFTNRIDDVGLNQLVSGITQQQTKPSLGNSQHFDVLLCHNEKDLNEVDKIARKLHKKQIQPWFSKWQVPPGRLLEQVLADQIGQIRSVAIFIGSEPHPWKEEIIESAIWEFIELKRPVIPIILQNSLQDSEIPIYLRKRRKIEWCFDEAEALYNLEWGITQTKPEIAPTVLDENNSSGLEINLAYLEKLLVAEKWQEADLETKRLLLESSGKKQEEKLGVDDIRNFSCDILSTIDDLWVKYSNGRFGFSVQNSMWHQIQKKPFWQPIKNKLFGAVDNKHEKDYWYSFGERVGWYKEYKQGQKKWVQYQSFIFNMNAPEGHLPCCREWWKGMRYEHEYARFSALMLRMEYCQQYQLK